MTAPFFWSGESLAEQWPSTGYVVIFGHFKVSGNSEFGGLLFFLRPQMGSLYFGTKAWGFINSDRFAGDLFVHRDSLLAGRPQRNGVVQRGPVGRNVF